MNKAASRGLQWQPRCQLTRPRSDFLQHSWPRGVPGFAHPLSSRGARGGAGRGGGAVVTAPSFWSCALSSHFPPLSFLAACLWESLIYIQVQGHFTRLINNLGARPGRRPPPGAHSPVSRVTPVVVVEARWVSLEIRPTALKSYFFFVATGSQKPPPLLPKPTLPSAPPPPLRPAPNPTSHRPRASRPLGCATPVRSLQLGPESSSGWHTYKAHLLVPCGATRDSRRTNSVRGGAETEGSGHARRCCQGSGRPWPHEKCA